MGQAEFSSGRGEARSAFPERAARRRSKSTATAVVGIGEGEASAARSPGRCRECPGSSASARSGIRVSRSGGLDDGLHLAGVAGEMLGEAGGGGRRTKGPWAASSRARSGAVQKVSLFASRRALTMCSARRSPRSPSPGLEGEEGLARTYQTRFGLSRSGAEAATECRKPGLEGLGLPGDGGDAQSARPPTVSCRGTR